MKLQTGKKHIDITGLAVTDDLQYHNLQVKNIFELVSLLISKLDNSQKDLNSVSKTIRYLNTLTRYGEQLVSKLDEAIGELWQHLTAADSSPVICE